MSAKLLHALTEDNPDLQKQIGCMTGIFQLFDRQQIITGKRITNHNHNQKRLPSPGHSHFDDSNLGDDTNNVCYPQPQEVTGKYYSNNVNEKQRISFESSRPSFSSSSSSSTFDGNKTTRPEPPPLDKNISPGTSSRDLPVNQRKAYTQLGGQQSLDFRNVVKDSMYKETRVLSVKATTKEEPVNHAVKRRDSPRPLQMSESVDGSYRVEVNGKSRVPADFTESLRALGKLREGVGYFNDTKERPRSSYESRNGSSFSMPKDAPRFSYDEQETHRSSFESQDSFKSITNLRELPRLSLDSRESSMRSSDSGPKPNSIFKDLQTDSGKAKRTPSTQQELGSQKQHSSSVVAKLMGLEAMPSPNLDIEGQRGLIKTYPGEVHDSFSRSLERAIERKQSRTSSSPRGSLKDPMSPRLRSSDFVMKPISNSRLPIEPAPWRQLDGGHGIQKPALRNREIQRRPPNSSPSVHADIENRLKELEFKQSDKDLRALKHMLDAMQEKRQLETKEEGNQASNFESQRNYSYLNHRSLDQLSRSGNRYNPQNNRPVSVTTKGARPYESPIVIMKPVKHIEKSCIPASSVIPTNGFSGLHNKLSGDSADGRKASVNSRMAKDQIPKPSLKEPAHTTISSTDKKVNRATLGSAHNTSRSQQVPKESTIGSGKNSGSISPRLQQKKLELEKQARPPIPSSDLSKHRKQPVRQTTESSSPGGKRRPKSPNLKQTDVQLSEISVETRNLSHQGDEISLRSDSNVSLASQIDIEVTSADQSAEINCAFFQQGSQSPSLKVGNNSVSVLKQEKPSHRQSGNGSLAEITPEHPSPVSVLYVSVYQDDLPSPVNNISDAFKDDGSRNSDNYHGEEWKPMDVGHLSEGTRPGLSSQINRKKLENVEHLVQKLRRLNSTHDESTTDYIASLCEKDNPDHRYISEILLASGLLLRDLGSGLTNIQLHPSGHPINPDLFLVLEQTKASSRLYKNNDSSEKVFLLKSDQEKVHRKLIFDAVNEVLDCKLPLLGPSTDPWLRDDKLVGRTLNAQQLLRELCTEIEKLQANQNLECSFEDDDGLKPILYKDVMSLSHNWTESRTEVSGVVLDVERLIFKDLVDEIVSHEAVALRAKPNRRRRQLFAK